MKSELAGVGGKSFGSGSSVIIPCVASGAEWQVVLIVMGP
jgi:hypothetical protein